ncbi:hypothetical protein BpHYR1_017828 [Brachionus plicatilis]|uniref:Uncharacterized protein n=1 Tax=Brachionus plicatilis TaxID=10195 RepID=A0A3M7RM99_BRAPC|nr:hypothetical protein BpHYR1_017828 [Brachionus plicatilis]
MKKFYFFLILTQLMHNIIAIKFQEYRKESEKTTTSLCNKVLSNHFVKINQSRNASLGILSLCSIKILAACSKFH